VLDQFWRGKEILDAEGVVDPKHILPGEKMSRLSSLLLCGDLKEQEAIKLIIERVVAGDGLDIVAAKDLMRQHVVRYDEYAAEIDRAIKWAALALNPIDPPAIYEENDVKPLSEVEEFQVRRPRAKERSERIGGAASPAPSSLTRARPTCTLLTRPLAHRTCSRASRPRATSTAPWARTCPSRCR
jgi:hypothetical protein